MQQQSVTAEPVRDTFERHLSSFWSEYRKKLISGVQSERQQKSLILLFSSIEYSLLSGGKRFRPLLALTMGQALGVSLKKVLPFSLAIEMVHTYSLIHDDLPALDNDDFRRGQPTNHKKFGEDIALLAGDALLTESFLLLTEAYVEEPGLVQKLTRVLGEDSGLRGMVAGQVLDLMAKGPGLNSEELEFLHRLKTGALIRACVYGVCEMAKIAEERQNHLLKFAEDLGLAFQLADDLLDADQSQEAHKSFVGLLGKTETQRQLQILGQKSLKNLEYAFLGIELNKDQQVAIQSLQELIQFNEQRKK